MTDEKSATWERELLQKWVTEINKEAKSERRWRYALRLVRSLSVLVFLSAFWFMTKGAGEAPWADAEKLDPHVAYIRIQGEITTGALTDSDHLIKSIKGAFQNPKAKAIILRINSPGGSPVHSGRIYDEIEKLKAQFNKPIYTVIDEMCASGGYYIASATDEIYADKASIVGSIGVITSGFGFTGLMEKLGVERRAITAGANKALLDPFSPLTPEIENFWRNVLATTHQQFIASVKKGRGDRLTENTDVFSGLMWTGEQALELGLVDGLGSMEFVAQEKVGIENLVDYTPTQDIIRRLTQRAQVEVSAFLSPKHEVAVY